MLVFHNDRRTAVQICLVRPLWGDLSAQHFLILSLNSQGELPISKDGQQHWHDLFLVWKSDSSVPSRTKTGWFCVMDTWPIPSAWPPKHPQGAESSHTGLEGVKPSWRLLIPIGAADFGENWALCGCCTTPGAHFPSPWLTQWINTAPTLGCHRPSDNP